MGKALKGYNRFDAYIFIIILSLALGNFGGALMVVRILAILLLPAAAPKIKSCNDYVRKYIAFFVVFYLFCILSLLWTPDVEQGFKELVYYPLHFLLFIEILVFARLAHKPLASISLGWVIAVSITLIIAVWEIRTSNHLSLSKFEADDITLNIGGIISNRPFAAVTFGNYNGYVAYLCFAMPFIFYFLSQDRNKTKRVLLSLVIFMTTIVTILVNASRGGLITLLIMGFVFTIFTDRGGYKLVVFLAVVVLVVYFIIPHTDSLFAAMRIKAEGDNLYTDSSRIIVWKNGFKVLLNYGLVGSGIGSISAALSRYSYGITITHNLFLEVLVQFGVVFFVMFIYYILTLLSQAKKQHDNSIKVTLYMALIALPIYSIIDSGYLLNPIVYVAFACLTVFAYSDVITIPKSYR